MDPKLSSSVQMQFMRPGQLEAAERQYRQAARLLPTDPEPYEGLGLVYHALGRPERARRALRRARRLDSSSEIANEMLERLGD